jgi:diacylglycerol kinase (ATP)
MSSHEPISGISAPAARVKPKPPDGPIIGRMLESATDIGRIRRAGQYSLSGLRAALSTEAAFRQELIVALVLAPLGVWLGRSGIERTLLVGSLVLVLIVELLNSAVESVVDRVGLERHVLSGRAKDMGSAAVLLAILLVVMTWGFILWERFAS